MSCAQPYAAETLLRGAISRMSGECSSLLVNQAPEVTVNIECGDALDAETIVAGLIDGDGLLKVNTYSGGGAYPIGCDEADRTLHEMIGEILMRTSDGGMAISVYMEEEIADCVPAECDDSATLAQMLRGAFVRLNSNDQLLLMTQMVPAGSAADCDQQEPIETALRRTMAMLAPGQYAMRITVP